MNIHKQSSQEGHDIIAKAGGEKGKKIGRMISRALEKAWPKNEGKCDLRRTLQHMLKWQTFPSFLKLLCEFLNVHS